MFIIVYLTHLEDQFGVTQKIGSLQKVFIYSLVQENKKKLIITKSV